MARNTTIVLYKDILLSASSMDTYQFDSYDQQTAFFNGKKLLTFENVVYTRDNRMSVRCETTMNAVRKVNYLSFINTDYENRRFYCFVNEVNYISDRVVEFVFEVDPIQTFYFESGINTGFIERTHTLTDTAGDNLLPDNFNLGEMVNNQIMPNVMPTNELCVMVECSFDPLAWTSSGYSTKSIPKLSKRSGNLFGATALLCIPVVTENATAGTNSAFDVFMSHVNAGDGGVTVNDIISIWLYPFNASTLNYNGSHAIGSQQGAPLNINTIFNIQGFTNGNIASGAQYLIPARPSTIDGYTPKNNKLLTAPFCQLIVTNNNGSAIQLNYEYFTNPNQPKVACFYTSTAEAKTRLVPLNYKGVIGETVDMSEAIDSAPYPVVSMVGDSYNIWVAQNRNTILNGFENIAIDYEQQMANAGLSGISSALSGDVGGALVSTVATGINASIDTTQTINTMVAKMEDTKVLPATVKGVQSVGLSFQSGINNFTGIQKTVDAYHARIIDDYYTAFGYPVRRIGVINRKNRQRFTYIKTVGVLSTAQIPNKYKRLIESRFDAGIRFWADKTNFGNMTLGNPLLTN